VLQSGSIFWQSYNWYTSNIAGIVLSYQKCTKYFSLSFRFFFV